MSRHLLRVSDLDDDEIEKIFARARALTSAPHLQRRFSTALLFLSPSMRTRVGFAAATVNLGGVPIDISELRWGAEMSAAESLSDTIRTVSGLVDLVVTRTLEALDPAVIRDRSRCPVINGGDGRVEHPSQALIDTFAMEVLAGPINTLRVAVVGDMTTRAARSLLLLLDRRRPRAIVLIAPPQRNDPDVEFTMPPDRIERRDTMQIDDCDVVVMIGLPPGAGSNKLDDAARARFVLRSTILNRLSDDAIVLSPLPVIDEIDDDARTDSRVRMFDQSDLGLFVRMALIEHLLEART